MGYRSFSQAMQARFGTKVYKLSLDGGMTCPNRLRAMANFSMTE